MWEGRNRGSNEKKYARYCGWSWYYIEQVLSRSKVERVVLVLHGVMMLG